MVLEEAVRDQPCGKFETVTEVDETRLDYLIGLARPVAGPRAKVRMWYADGTELRLHLDGDWGPGLGAHLHWANTASWRSTATRSRPIPEELLDDPGNPGPITKPETQYHIEDWVACIKTRERCTADIEYGLRSTTLGYLVNIVREVGRVGERLRWDPQDRTVHQLRRSQPVVVRPAAATKRLRAT